MILDIVDILSKLYIKCKECINSIKRKPLFIFCNLRMESLSIYEILLYIKATCNGLSLL